MLRRLEFLLNEVRQSTDNKDVNGIPDNELISYFNAGQKTIESIIFKTNPYADFFKAQIEIPAVTTGEYDIPEDCYSDNAVSLVEVRVNITNVNKGYSRVKPISESEFNYMFGYFIRNKKLYISGQNNIAQMLSVRITYFKKVKTLDIRRAKILSFTANTNILMDSTPTEMYSVDDWISTCDSVGDQVAKGINFTNTSGSLLLVTDTTDVAANQYVLIGKDSCNRSEFPESCEPYLLDYVRQRIYTRNNYEDAKKQLYFTEQQRSELVAIFANNKKDELTIPITDVGFLMF